MTTEKQAGNTTATDNKAIFGPLGKYAVIAIIMVSIIVTTAIMLEKELSDIDKQVAEIQTEIAETNKTNQDSSEVTAATDDNNITNSAEVTPQTSAVVETPTADIYVSTKTESTVTAKEAKKDSNQTTEATASAEDMNATPAPATHTSVEPTAQTSTASTTEQNHAAVRQTELTDRKKAREEARQARIDEFKLEQKLHMTELLTRIKTLESEQLDRYKASQQSQVDHLREQVAHQQKMIEALILRNKAQYDLRSANIQRNQSTREQILNRI